MKLLEVMLPASNHPKVCERRKQDGAQDLNLFIWNLVLLYPMPLPGGARGVWGCQKWGLNFSPQKMAPVGLCLFCLVHVESVCLGASVPPMKVAQKQAGLVQLKEKSAKPVLLCPVTAAQRLHQLNLALGSKNVPSP